jgi:hypothetical protein
MSPSLFSAGDLLAAGWSARAIVEQTMALDEETFGSMAPQVEGTDLQWIELTVRNPETVFVLIDSSAKVIGYWHFVLLHNHDFELAKEGRLSVDELTADRVRGVTPGVFPIYFVAITTVGKSRTIAVVRYLFESIVQEFERFALKGVYFDRLCASAYTNEGERLCRSLDMSPIAKGPQGTVYYRSLFPFPRWPILRGHPLLVKLYSECFGESWVKGA